MRGGKTSLTLNESAITAFGGVRVPLGVPNLELYGTVGACTFFSGTKLSVNGPRIVQRDRNREQGLGHAGRRLRRAL
jgi:hypothetical protein